MRELIETALLLVAMVLLVFVLPVAVFLAVVFFSRKGWLVKLKRLIGGVLVAVGLAAMGVAITHPKPDVLIECGWYSWPFCRSR